MVIIYLSPSICPLHLWATPLMVENQLRISPGCPEIPIILDTVVSPPSWGPWKTQLSAMGQALATLLSPEWVIQPSPQRRKTQAQPLMLRSTSDHPEEARIKWLVLHEKEKHVQPQLARNSAACCVHKSLLGCF